MASILRFDTWQNSAGVAKQTVIQAVESVYTGQATYSGMSTWTNGPLAATITPSSTSSRIVILSYIVWDINGETTCLFRFTRNGATFSLGADGYASQFGEGNNGNTSWATQTSQMMVDSPGTTSAVTYQLQMYPYDSGRTVYYNRSVSGGGVDNAFRTSRIVLLEMSA